MQKARYRVIGKPRKRESGKAKIFAFTKLLGFQRNGRRRERGKGLFMTSVACTPDAAIFPVASNRDGAGATGPR